MVIRAAFRSLGLAALLAAAAYAQETTPPLAISSTNPLPRATLGSPYSFQFQATGGRAPYQWGLTGNLPSGIAFNGATGVLSGTPAAYGTANFNITVTDAANTTVSRGFSLPVAPAPLAIATQALFSATVGVPYSQTFTASGGVPPYRWSFGGSADTLTFSPTTATLSGTPQTAGTYGVTVNLTDSIGTGVSQAFNLVVEVQKVIILNAAALPAARAGAAYSTRFSASGGTTPYAWSVISGSIDGLALDPSSGEFSGTPAAAGDFSIAVQVRDARGTTVARTFTLSVAPGALSITGAPVLPAGMLGTAFRQAVTVSGGVEPFTWSANGLPAGLSMDAATGVITGTPQVPGSYSFSVRVTDSQRESVSALLRVTINAPALPEFTLTGLPAAVNAAEQFSPKLSIGSAYPVALAGRLELTFTPDSGAGDTTVRFSTGDRSVPFTIAAGSNEIVFPSSVGLQTGTTAGEIRLTVRVETAGVDITPAPPTAFSARLERGAPQIRSATLTRSGSTISVQLVGYCTAAEIAQAVFRFKAAAGTDLRSSEITVPVQDLFAKWYGNADNAQYGTQFTFTQNFTVQGDASAVSIETVTFSNRFGTASTAVR